MTDEQKFEVIRTTIREELSSIKSDINDHKQTHEELEALVEKRFKETKEMFPEFSGDWEAFKAFMEAHKLGNSYLDWAAVLDDIYII